MGLNASDLAAISKKSDAEENHPIYQIISNPSVLKNHSSQKILSRKSRWVSKAYIQSQVHPKTKHQISS